MDRRLANVPGFGGGPRCPYLASAPAELCYACARRTVEALADPASRCPVCDRPYDADEKSCRNPLCGSASRWLEWNFAIAMRSGQLERAINAYKFQGVTDWALIFGRILAGFLEEEATFRKFDLMTSSPT